MATLTGKQQTTVNLSVQRLETQHFARPELWNPQFQELLNNDATLQDRLQNLGETYMPKAGGTFSGTLELGAGKALQSRNPSGALVNLVVVDKDGDVVVGATTQRLRLHSSLDPVVQRGDEAYTMLHTGNHALNATDVHGVAAPFRVAKTSDAEGFVSWSELKNRPASLPPGPHSHSDLYYTKTEGNGRYVGQYGNGQVRGSLMVGDTQYNSPPKITLAIGDDDTGLEWYSPGQFSLISQNTRVAEVYYGGLQIPSDKYLSKWVPERSGSGETLKEYWHPGNLRIYQNTYSISFAPLNGYNDFDADRHYTKTVSFPEAEKGDFVLVAPPDGNGYEAALQVYGFVDATGRIRITAQHHSRNGNMITATSGWRVMIIKRF